MTSSSALTQRAASAAATLPDHVPIPSRPNPPLTRFLRLFSHSGGVALRLLGVYVVTIIVMVAALVASNAIPNDKISDHVYYSMAAKGWEPPLMKWGGFDFFTECVSVTAGLIVTDEPTTPLKRALLSPTLFECETAKKAFDTHVGGFYYWRYWNGYQVISRPILYFFDVYALRTVIAFSFLVSLLLYYNGIYRHAGPIDANLFVLALFFAESYSHIAIISHALVWIIGFLAGAWLLFSSWPSAWLDKHHLSLFFFLGMVTSFVDFLTTPIVTLTLPLLALYLADRWPTSRYGGMRTPAIIAMSAVWGAGYLSCWAAKWLLATTVLGGGMEEVLGIVGYRMGGGLEGESTSPLHSIAKTFQHMPYGLLVFLAIALFRIAVRWRTLSNPFSSTDQGLTFSILALLPIAWLVLVRNHSVVHAWFVAPILIPSMVLIVGTVWRATSNRQANAAAASLA